MQKDIKKIIELSVNAPSGDNSQPWIFKIEENNILIYNTSIADSSMYNFKQRGSLIAHGALIENIRLVSSKFGYKTSIVYLPDINNNIFSKITFISDVKNKNNIIDSLIIKRCTNRKPYKKKQLPKNIIDDITNIVNHLNLNVNVSFYQDIKNFNKFGKVLSLNEKLIFENKQIHTDLFKSIKWKKQDELNMGGMFVKALELKLPQQIMFKILSNWKYVDVFNKIRIADFIAYSTTKLYCNTGAFGLLTCLDKDPITFIHVGQVFQSIWLVCTRHNISLQPVTALLYLKQRIDESDDSRISNKHKNLISEAYLYFKKIFELENQTPVMLFRVGYSDTPTYRSQKKKPIYI